MNNVTINYDKIICHVFCIKILEQFYFIFHPRTMLNKTKGLTVWIFVFVHLKKRIAYNAQYQCTTTTTTKTIVRQNNVVIKISVCHFDFN